MNRKISLEDVISDATLRTRPSRPPSPETENSALLSLMQQMADASPNLLQQLACTILSLCRAHSAGVSVAEEENGRRLCRWRGAAGKWAGLLGSELPLELSLSGLVLDRGCPLLLSHPEHHFPVPFNIGPPAVEVLVVPFRIANQPVGAIWAASHEEGFRFDAEDQRLLASLANFAGAAYQVWSSQKRLEESEHRFRQIIDALPAAVYTTDAAGFLTYVNPAVVEIAGRVPELGKDRWCASWKMYRPDGTPLPDNQSSMAVSLNKGRSVLGEEIIAEQPDGKRVWLASYSVPIFDTGGNVTGGTNMLLDITEHRIGEGSERYQQSEFRDFIENASIGLHWLAPDGRIIWANQADLDLLGYAREEYVGHPVGEFYFDPELVSDLLERAARGEPVNEFEARMRHRDGSVRHLLINPGALIENGALIHIRCFTRDLTQRKIGEEALARLAAIVESSDDAIVSKTLEGVITSWNRGAERLFGYTAQEAVGQHISLIVPEDRLEEEQGVLASIRRGERIDHFETVRQAKDGRRLQISLTVSPIRDSGGRLTGASKVARDITERKLAEEDLRQTQKLESIGVLAGGIAHDFNNLLTGILGNASLAMESLPLASTTRMLLNEVLHASERAATLTRQMLAYAGKGQFVLEPVDMSGMVREISTLIRASIPKSVELRLDLADFLPAIKADAAQMQQLIMNLVINGGEAIVEGRTGTVRVTTMARNLSQEYLRHMFRQVEMQPGLYLILEVRDSGCGMDEATRMRIFDPFFTTKFTGRGLGLAAVLGIVRSHHGAIRVSSTPGQGTTFEVIFPIPQPLGDSSGPGETEIAALNRPMTILVVDDEDIVRRTAKATLQKCGCAVLLAQNGMEAVEIVRSFPGAISAVLLDLTMPVMSGDETLEHLRAIQPDLPVILTSGYNLAESLGKIDPNHLAGFLQKPYTATELVEKISAIIA